MNIVAILCRTMDDPLLSTEAEVWRARSIVVMLLVKTPRVRWRVVLEGAARGGRRISVRSEGCAYLSVPGDKNSSHSYCPRL